MKIYIAGPITGIQDYKERFGEAERQLRAKGHTVMNPAILPEGFDHLEYMHICLPMVEVCEAVVFLPGWEKSKGAQMEYHYAERRGRGKYFDLEDVPPAGSEQPGERTTDLESGAINLYLLGYGDGCEDTTRQLMGTGSRQPVGILQMEEEAIGGSGQTGIDFSKAVRLQRMIAEGAGKERDNAR